MKINYQEMKWGDWKSNKRERQKRLNHKCKIMIKVKQEWVKESTIMKRENKKY